MIPFLRALSNESVLLAGFISSILVATNVPDSVQEVIMAAVPFILAILVRMVVTSPESLLQATTKAATQTASDIVTAGPLGQITEDGLRASGDAVTSVIQEVGGLVPTLLGVRKK